MEKVTENALDLMNQGVALMSREKYTEAKEKLEESLQDSPHNYACYIHLGNCNTAAGDYDAAWEAFKKALLLDKNSSEALFQLGNVMYLRGDTLEAVKYYNKAEEKGQLTASMYDIMSEVFRAENDNVQALRCLNHALQIEPLNGLYYIEKTEIFINEGKAEQALDTLREMNRLLPDAYEAYDMLSEIYTELGDWKMAWETVEKGVSRFPEDSNLAYLKLKVLVAFEKDEDAIAYAQEMQTKGLYQKKADKNALQMATVYARLKDVDKAAGVLEDVCKDGYKNHEVAYALMNLYARTSRPEKVKEISEAVLKLEYNTFYTCSAMYYHADALLRLGKQTEAKKEFKDLTRSLRRETVNDPSFYEGYIYRLLAHKELKEYDKALQLADYLENLYPERVDGHAFRYIIYKDMGDSAKAESEKQKVFDINPDFQL